MHRAVGTGLCREVLEKYDNAKVNTQLQSSRVKSLSLEGFGGLLVS